MPDISYLCIDDQQDNTVDTLLTSISTAGGPTFERRTPIEVGEQIQVITDFSEKCDGNFGLLLDLRLDTESDKNGNKVPYRGPTLAQELRTRMAEGTIRFSFPIVLWSIANNFSLSYQTDDTSHDLFDAVYGKDSEILNERSRTAIEMKSLVNGYKSLRGHTERASPTSILDLTEDDIGGVYGAFLDEFSIALQSKSSHKAAKLLLTQLINPAGLLASEALIAARLGVDIAASEDSWTELKKQIEGTCYSGPFSDGWERWWWFKLEDWWSSLSEKQPSLRRVTASERVKIINSKFGLTLIEAKPPEGCANNKFFTLCVATGLPLDPMDGFRVTQTNRKPWHDTAYVSMTAALHRVNKEKWRIDPIDRDRFDSVRMSQSS